MIPGINTNSGGVPRCPNCGAMWTMASKEYNRCTSCGRTMQDWAEIKEAPNFIERYKNVNQWGV